MKAMSKPYGEEATTGNLILEAIIAAGMRGSFLQDHEFDQLCRVVNHMAGKERGKIIPALVQELHQIQPYNPSRQTQR